MPVKEYERHPLSADYKDLEGDKWEDFRANLRKNGIVNGRKVMLWEGKVIDGWQLYRACQVEEVKPHFEDLKIPKGMTIEEWVDTQNDFRRHEDFKVQARRRKERISRVVEAREDGASLREIAANEGISQGQVRRDLDEAAGNTTPTVSPDTVESNDGVQNNQNGEPEKPKIKPKSGKVKGMDGRTRTATPKKPSWEKSLTKLLEKGKIDANAAEEIRQMTNDADRLKVIKSLQSGKKPKPKENEEEVKVDDGGLPIPSHVLPAFKGRQEIRRVGRLFDELKHEVADLADNPGINPAVINGIVAGIQNAKGSMMANQASHICPYCHAKKKQEECNACRGRGWVIKLIFDQAPKGGK